MKIGSKQICSRSIYDGHCNLYTKIPGKQSSSVGCSSTYLIVSSTLDCMNTRNLYEAKNNRNDALLPYTSKDNPRLEVYLDQ